MQDTQGAGGSHPSSPCSAQGKEHFQALTVLLKTQPPRFTSPGARQGVRMRQEAEEGRCRLRSHSFCGRGLCWSLGQLSPKPVPFSGVENSGAQGDQPGDTGNKAAVTGPCGNVGSDAASFS